MTEQIASTISMDDEYLNKKLLEIRNCKTDEEILDIIDKIYDEGFYDGLKYSKY